MKECFIFLPQIESVQLTLPQIQIYKSWTKLRFTVLVYGHNLRYSLFHFPSAILYMSGI